MFFKKKKLEYIDIGPKSQYFKKPQKIKILFKDGPPCGLYSCIDYVYDELFTCFIFQDGSKRYIKTDNIKMFYVQLDN